MPVRRILSSCDVLQLLDKSARPQQAGLPVSLPSASLSATCTGSIVGDVVLTTAMTGYPACVWSTACMKVLQNRSAVHVSAVWPTTRTIWAGACVHRGHILEERLSPVLANRTACRHAPPLGGEQSVLWACLLLEAPRGRCHPDALRMASRIPRPQTQPHSSARWFASLARELNPSESVVRRST